MNEQPFKPGAAVAVDGRLRTRATLQRMARRLGHDAGADNYVIAGQIEDDLYTILGILSRYVVATGADIRCRKCGDDAGPFGIIPGGFLCEDCLGTTVEPGKVDG